jgi:hypothetical protein
MFPFAFKSNSLEKERETFGQKETERVIIRLILNGRENEREKNHI